MPQLSFYLGNLGAMRDFYTTCFDLAVADDAKTYCGLESDAWALMLVQSAKAAPKTLPPPRRAATPVKLAFDVPSIEAVRAGMKQLGGHLDPDDTT